MQKIVKRIPTANRSKQEYKIIPKNINEPGNKSQLFNSNKSPTRCNNIPVYYPDVYL
jgi:hypothetical protein